MPEHLIRLRAAWELHHPGADAPRRVDLPTSWIDAEPVGPFQLLRRFGCPRFDPAHGSVALELVDVPGLQAIRLNDAPLALPSGGSTRIDVGGALLDRNVLKLDVDLVGLGRTDLAGSWGAIALVVSSDGVVG